MLILFKLIPELFVVCVYSPYPQKVDVAMCSTFSFKFKRLKQV